MAFSGDLATFDLIEILEWVERRSRSGRLILRRLSTEKRVGFMAGRLHSSASNDPRETLGQVLVRDQLLNEEDLFKALLRQESEKRLLGEILVADLTLTPDQLRRALEAKTEETVYDVFLWPDGHFEFEDGTPSADAPVKIDMDLKVVLSEGRYRLERWRELHPLMPPTATFIVQGGGAGVDDPADREILRLAAEDKTLSAISLETRRSAYETTLRLHALLNQGALGMGVVRPEGAPLDPVGAIQALLGHAERLAAEHVFDGALQAYQAVLTIDGLNQEAKKGLVALMNSRKQWKMFDRMPLEHVPVVVMGSMALTKERFEPAEGFVLSRINGTWSLAAILKLCPMAEADALTIFARLIERRVIELRH